MDDLLLVAKVRVSLIDLKPDVEVSAKNGIVFIKTKAAEFQEEDLVHKFEEAARSISGVKDVEVQVSPSVPFGD